MDSYCSDAGLIGEFATSQRPNSVSSQRKLGPNSPQRRWIDGSQLSLGWQPVGGHDRVFCRAWHRGWSRSPV